MVIVRVWDKMNLVFETDMSLVDAEAYVLEYNTRHAGTKFLATISY